MVNENLVRYVRENLARGFSIQEIEAGLLSQGIGRNELSEALQSLNISSDIEIEPKKDYSKNSGESNYGKPIKARPKYFRFFLWIFLFVLLAFLVVLVLFFLRSKDSYTKVLVQDYSVYDGISLNITRNSIVEFEMDSTNYSFSLEEVDNDKIILSGDLYGDIAVGNKKYFDLYGDGVNDIYIEFLEFDGVRANIYLKGLQDIVCPENWQCSNWSPCINGSQKRVCIDVNYCGTEKDKPNLELPCQKESPVENETLKKTPVNCSLVPPDCGVLNLSNAYVEQSCDDSGCLNVSRYDKNCEAICMGKSLFNGCENASTVIFDDQDGQKYEFRIGNVGDNCTISDIITDPAGDETVSVGDYFTCSFPYSELSNYTCSLFGGECYGAEDPGDAAVNLNLLFTFAYYFGENETCSGNLTTINDGI